MPGLWGSLSYPTDFLAETKTQRSAVPPPRWVPWPLDSLPRDFGSRRAVDSGNAELPHRPPGEARGRRPVLLSRGLCAAWESLVSCLQTMQGAGGHTVRGRLHRQLDLELKQAKQAEARLSQHLQRLEQTCLHQLRMLSWEQRQLRGHLQRLQPGEPTGRAGGSVGTVHCEQDVPTRARPAGACGAGRGRRSPAPCPNSSAACRRL